MYCGIDLGTSSLKVVLIDEDDRLVASAARPLALKRPHPGWSEQDPAAWWSACTAALDELKEAAPAALAAVRGIGLSGQMHGAVLLDAADRVLRPAILWNDGRAMAECAAFEAACPESRRLSGNLAMPGFTAPKLLWVRGHEPAVFAATRSVLLPKDHLRLHLTGEKVSEPSDAAGTLWLDVARRDWSEPLLAACGLDRAAMPRLVEGSAASGRLRAELAARWGMAVPPVVAGGGGDNAASACGVGAVGPGAAFVSLGTSGVLFVATDRFLAAPERAVHSFCHALPGVWHQMAVILSATASLEWLAAVCGRSVAALVADLPEAEAGAPFFLPYLSGERTPHNDSSLRGLFAGLGAEQGAGDLARAVLEGVAFALRDGRDALAAAGTEIHDLIAVGGGARSRPWLQILADALEREIDMPADPSAGAALGAARLGRLAAEGAEPAAVCRPPELRARVTPDTLGVSLADDRFRRWRRLQEAAKELAQTPEGA